MAKTCNSCNAETNIVTMSGANFEANEQRHERREKRLVIAVIISVIATLILGILLFANNYMWLRYESQFETIDYSYEQDGDGNNIIGDSNEVEYFGAKAENKGETETQK